MKLNETEKEKLIEGIRKLYNSELDYIEIENCDFHMLDSRKIKGILLTFFHGKENGEELFELLSSYGNIYKLDALSRDIKMIKVSLENIFYTNEEFEFGFSQFILTDDLNEESHILLNCDEDQDEVVLDVL
jgi:hypothetical protein